MGVASFLTSYKIIYNFLGKTSLAPPWFLPVDW